MISRSETDTVRRLTLKRGRPSAREGRYVEEFPLPAALDGSGAVTLEHALAAAQATLPTVIGLAAGDGKLTVTHCEEPDNADRQRLHALLSDPAALRAAAPAAKATAPPEDEALRARLRDDTAPDVEWLRLFRRWAVTAGPLAPGEGH
jgi:hypothetical protein